MSYRNCIAAMLTCGAILAMGTPQLHAKPGVGNKSKKHGQVEDKQAARRPKAEKQRSDESQSEAIHRQSEQLEKIHALRLAKLKRIRQLAQEKDNQRLIAKVDQLVEKENRKYADRKARLAARGARLIGKQHSTMRPSDKHDHDDKAQVDRVKGRAGDKARGQERRGRKEMSNKRGKGRHKAKSIDDREEDRDQSKEDER